MKKQDEQPPTEEEEVVSIPTTSSCEPDQLAVVKRLLQEAGHWMTLDERDVVLTETKKRVRGLDEVILKFVRQTRNLIRIWRESPPDSKWYRVAFASDSLTRADEAWSLFGKALAGLHVMVPEEICYVASSQSCILIMRVDGPSPMRVAKAFAGLGKMRANCPLEIRTITNLGHLVNIFLMFFRCYCSGNNIGQARRVTELLRTREDKARVLEMVLEADNDFRVEYYARMRQFMNERGYNGGGGGDDSCGVVEHALPRAHVSLVIFD